MKRAWNMLRPLATIVMLGIAVSILMRDETTYANTDRTPAPAFTLPDLHGAPTSLASYRGHPVLLNFWATWCPPCRAELPDLQSIAQAKPNCLQVVGVSEGGDPPGALARFAENEHLTYPILLDSDDVGGNLYGVRTIPHSVLIDENGQTVGTFDGPLSPTALERVLAKLPKQSHC